MGDERRDKRTVLVTGFCPFGKHKVNASWEAVKELANIGLGPNIELETKEIPVVYEKVKQLVPSLWKRYQPQLVVHVGVSHCAEHLELEQLAHNTGYSTLDVELCKPNTGCCDDSGCDVIVSDLDMSRVCDDVNNSKCGAIAVKSTDPGRYLCDYSYYTSLNIDKTCSAFIHVPDLNLYSVQLLASGIKQAILAMLRQIEEKVK